MTCGFVDSSVDRGIAMLSLTGVTLRPHRIPTGVKWPLCCVPGGPKQGAGEFKRLKRTCDSPGVACFCSWAATIIIMINRLWSVYWYSTNHKSDYQILYETRTSIQGPKLIKAKKLVSSLARLLPHHPYIVVRLYLHAISLDCKHFGVCPFYVVQ